MLAFLALAGCDKDDALVAVSDVTLNRTALEMSVGDTEKLIATVLPENAEYDGIVWNSGNTSVATVGADGLVTAITAGNATITATAGGKSGTCSVIVTGGDISPGNINMNSMTVDEVKTAIKAAFDAGITEFTLTGPIANLGLSGEDLSVNPFYNTAVTKLDLSGVTDWEPVNIDGSTNPIKTVVGVPETAFLSCTALQTVVLPEQVKAIGHNAFNYCPLLSEINLENVTHIGYCAFTDCSALKEVDMSEVTTIYKGAFWRAGLIALSLPKATSISEGIADGNSGAAGSFSSCQSLASVEAPLLTNTGYFSFAGCTALKTVNMPELTEIKQEAFYNTGLESINLGKVTTVGKRAFERCGLLTKVKLPSLATIGDYAFINCIRLEEIELPATTIGSYLFGGCTELTTLSLPNAKTFGYNIVADCSALTNLKLTAAGALVDLDGTAIWEISFGSPSFSDFKYGKCALVLNTDKQQFGSGSPTVTDATTWLDQAWKNITFE